MDIFGSNVAQIYLIDLGADIDKANDSGQTPLFIALINGYEDIAKYLIDHKADVNKSDSSGKTPLSIAKQKGFNELPNYKNYKHEDFLKELNEILGINMSIEN